MTIITVLVLTLLTQQSYSSVNLNSWEAFRAELNEQIINSDVLADFWYGDDGIDCGEPSFTVTGINFDASLINIEITQAEGTTYGCIKSPFVCEMRYSFTDDSEIKLETVDLINDCDF